MPETLQLKYPTRKKQISYFKDSYSIFFRKFWELDKKAYLFENKSIKRGISAFSHISTIKFAMKQAEDFVIYPVDKIEKQIRGLKFSFPFELIHILNEIENSSNIIDLDKNWDDEGALQISFNTWKKATLFISNYSKWIYNNQNVIISEPDIAAVSDGSIDLTWSSEHARLLVNIKEAETTASYYGDYFTENNNIKGNIPMNEINEFFAYWLKVFKV